jgi:hypothetical protein
MIFGQGVSTLRTVPGMSPDEAGAGGDQNAAEGHAREHIRAYGWDRVLQS